MPRSKMDVSGMLHDAVTRFVDSIKELASEAVARIDEEERLNREMLTVQLAVTNQQLRLETLEERMERLEETLEERMERLEERLEEGLEAGLEEEADDDE